MLLLNCLFCVLPVRRKLQIPALIFAVLQLREDNHGRICLISSLFLNLFGKNLVLIHGICKGASPRHFQARIRPLSLLLGNRNQDVFLAMAAYVQKGEQC